MTHTRPRIAIPVPTSGNPAYNARSWPQYAHAVEEAGGEPVRVELEFSPASQAAILATVSGVLLPGSPADVNPERYGQAPDPRCAPADAAREAADELLLQDAFNLHKPVLGICYGMQSMNVWSGGTLIQHLETGTDHRAGRTVAEAHPVEVAPESLLSRLNGRPGPVQTNSSHHQAVAEIGDRLRCTAMAAPDRVVEAMEGTGPQFVLGVQWHPERTIEVSSLSQAIFRAFVEAAASWRPPFPSPDSGK